MKKVRETKYVQQISGSQMNSLLKQFHQKDEYWHWSTDTNATIVVWMISQNTLTNPQRMVVGPRLLIFYMIAVSFYVDLYSVSAKHLLTRKVN